MFLMKIYFPTLHQVENFNFLYTQISYSNSMQFFYILGTIVLLSLCSINLIKPKFQINQLQVWK